MASPIAEVMRKLKDGELAWGSAFTDTMLLMDWNASTGWSPPRVQPYGPLNLPPSASIFHYGMEVFEGLKAYKTAPSLPDASDGQVRLFRPELNIARLNRSARRLALPTVDEAGFLDTLTSFIDQQQEWVPSIPGASLYIRPAIIATQPRIGVGRSDSALLFVITSPVSSFFSSKGSAPDKCQKGIRLLANPTYVRAWKGGVGDCKTGGNYAATISPAEEAADKGFDQILWLSDAERRLVTEVGMMNIIFVFRDDTTGRKRLVTPRLDGTILNGVTRRSVLDLAEELKIPFEERDISLDEVCDAVEAGRIVEIFGTGTGAVICPVYSISTEDRTVCVQPEEAKQDLSVMFRERLCAIQTSDKPHPWMVPVSGTPPEAKASSLPIDVSVTSIEAPRVVAVNAPASG